MSFPPLDRRQSNPISLRIFYPRIVADEDFARLLADLKYINADRVYLFDIGYMDNFQLGPQTLAERLPVLRRRVAQLGDAGITTGINPGTTIGHTGDFIGAERLMDLDWWHEYDTEPQVVTGVACPLGERFQAWIDEYFTAIAETGTTEVFVDDDLRVSDHSFAAPDAARVWGCFCPLHMAALQEQCGREVSPEELLEALGKYAPGPIQEAWFSIWRQSLLDLLARITRAVHGVNPEIRIGIMSLQFFSQFFGEDFLQEAIAMVSGSNRPLLRTQDYHGMPHEMYPGSGLYIKQIAPAASEHVIEIENHHHNVHEFRRSPKLTRYAVLSGLATGMGGAAISHGDSERSDMLWERKYLDMFRENDGYFRTVADLTMTGTVMRGVPIRLRVHGRRNLTYFDVPKIWFDTFDESTDILGGMLGFGWQFETATPLILTGELPAAMTSVQIEATLARGAVIDVSALQCLHRLGFGERLGVRVGERVGYRRGHRFLDHPFNAAYTGDVVPLRSGWPVYHLEVEHTAAYEELTEFTTWSGKRVAGGVLMGSVASSRPGSDAQSRTVILPHVLSHRDPHAGIVLNTQYRSLLRHLLGAALGRPVSLWVDGPPRIAPFCFDRPTDGAVIITLLNAYYDDVTDFDLLLGDGQRLVGGTVRRVMPDGRLVPRPGLQVKESADGYRLRIHGEDVLPNCDVMVLVVGGDGRDS